MISKTAVIFPNVKIGKNCIIEDFVIIGKPPIGYKSGELKTEIGDNATIRSHTVIYAGNKIGNNFKSGDKANIREFNKIGNDVSIGALSAIEHHVKIGDGVRIHTQVFISEFSVLEDRCWIGPNAVLTNVLHPVCPKAKECIKGATVKKHAKIGANVTVLPAVVIGEHTLVGAGSVVVKNVSPHQVMAGNPASVIKAVKDLKCRYRLIKRPYKQI